MKNHNVCLIGMFPPPLHGMSLINEYVRKRVSLCCTPLVIDFSPRYLDRSFRVRFGKIFRVIRCVAEYISFLLKKRVGPVYLGLSGGNGMIYDIIFVAISRVFSRRLYLHHHSYQYLIQVRWFAKILLAIAGKNAIHVVACEKMAGDLKRKYSVVNNIKIISGIAALEPWNDDVFPRVQVKTIGFLSNISIEKGILEFLDIAKWADQTKQPIRFVLAGPYQDEQVKCLVEEHIANFDNVTYVGGVYGANKREFLDLLDILLFPTKNESEGLVIHEAMSRAVPVIAYSRGCIEQIISDSVGLRLAPSADYVTDTANKISGWLSDPLLFHQISKTAFKQYCEARAMNKRRMDQLCAELIGEELD